jgi:hypothetical protein
MTDKSESETLQGTSNAKTQHAEHLHCLRLGGSTILEHGEEQGMG